MSIEKSGMNSFKIILEGVPLDNYKSTDWSYSCNGQVNGKTIVCGEYSLDFFSGNGQVVVNYSGNEKQVFINNKQDIKEDVKLYEKKREGKY